MSPEFQDPPAVPNYPPYFVDSDPYRETTVTVGSDTSVQIKISVTVADPNPQDVLYVRWVGDYPPYTPANSRQLTPDLTLDPPTTKGTDGARTIEYAVDCKVFAKNMNEHRLVVIVADQPLVSAEQAEDRDHRYNEIAMRPRYQALMSAWNIVCPAGT